MALGSETGVSGGATSEAARLALYLKDHPDALSLDSEMLSKRAGVSVDTIRRARNRAESTARTQETKPKRRRSGEANPGFFERVASMWNAVTLYPAWFVVITTIIAVGVTTLFDSAPSAESQSGVFSVDASNGAAFLVALVLQWLMYFTRGQGRVVLQGALGIYGVSLVGSLILVVTDPPDGSDSRLAGFFILAFAFIFISAFYALISMVFSVFGALYKLRKENRSRDRLTRMELLELLFDIQDRLAKGPEQAVLERDWRHRPVFRDIQRNYWAWNFVVGFGFSTVTVLLAGALSSPRFGVEGEDIKIALVLGLLGLIGFLFQAGLAFLGRTLGRSILGAIVYSVSGIPALFLPFGGFGLERFMRAYPENVIGSVVSTLMIGFVAGVGAVLEERRTHQRLMKGDDPETLLAELIDLQQRLNPGQREVTVMVVDAARSSVMKSMADPYVAEWSFRAYQQLLERITDEHGGEVLSTAGDGAVMTFDDPRQALEAAFAVQERIGLFNKNVNKLSMPFRLRVGLHMGAVAGQIDKVQYTSVIDIAAHVEAASLVDGVAVSQPVLDAIPGLTGEPIEILIDGFTCYHLVKAL